MDKVIIDGVDVSGCNMKCDNGVCALYYAELNNDNNELIYGFYCSDNQDCYYKQLKRLEQECEKLKKEFKDTTEGLLKIQYTLADSCKKYEQALQEIREICKNSHTSASEDFYRTADKIQEKINEVIGAEE